MMTRIKSMTVCFIRVISAPFILTALFNSCAQMLVPSGGDKDVIPPKVVKYMPDSAAVNFRSTEINLAFNEFIQLKDINNQLIISPLLEEQPEIKLLRNKIINISFKKPLKENTTYTLNFGSAIADYNEGNVLEGFRYIFSTGSFIDSLAVSGKVVNAFDLKTEKGILVMLYEDLSDSVPYKSPPSYFTKTKPDGSFLITNMRPGKYKVFAVKDENKNYKYDAESEFIAFTDTLAEAGSKKQMTLHLFKEVPKKLKLLNVKAEEYGHVLLIFNKPIEKPQVKTLNVPKFPTEILEFSRNKDSLHYWYAGVKVDSLKLQISENNSVFDTALVRVVTKEQMEKTSKGTKLKLNLTTNVTGGSLNPVHSLAIKANHPFYGKNYAIKNIILLRGKDTLDHDDVMLPLYAGNDTALNASLTADDFRTIPPDSVSYFSAKGIRWIPGRNYKLLILPNAITDIFGMGNDTVKAEFKTQEEKFYGTLKLKFSVPKGNYILQFLDNKETAVKEERVSEGKTVDYSFIPPGSYKFRLIYDSNNNGKWDPGNYLEKKQSEKVIYYDQPITIRSNWDLEIEWKVKE